MSTIELSQFEERLIIITYNRVLHVIDQTNMYNNNNNKCKQFLESHIYYDNIIFSINIRNTIVSPVYLSKSGIRDALELILPLKSNNNDDYVTSILFVTENANQGNN